MASSPVGYGLVADCMSCDADLALYRRFGALNTRNLLYLQSELLALETRLQELDHAADDISKGSDVWSIPRSWYYLEKAGGEHFDVVTKIRTKLNEYNEALRHQAWLLSLKKPEARPLKNLISFIQENRRQMSQADAEFLASKHNADLVALSRQEKEVMFRILEKHLYWIFRRGTGVSMHPYVGEEFMHRFLTMQDSDERSSDTGRMSVYSDGKIRNAVRLLAIIGSSLLPILSIVVLYVIASQTVRLACIVIFSALCSVTLATLSNARNAEIIAATAAYVNRNMANQYAAVQVVFVSGNVSV